jgi:hypothetical protein
MASSKMSYLGMMREQTLLSLMLNSFSKSFSQFTSDIEISPPLSGNSTCMISIKSETNKIKTFSNINNSEDTLSTFLAI